MQKMQSQQRTNNQRLTEFFLVSLSYDNIENYFKTNFTMMQYHKYSLSEIEDMIPWERQIYVALLNNHIEEENEKIKNRNNQM